MTKKTTTTPVVKEEKPKTKRVRKTKTTEKPIAVETPLQPDGPTACDTACEETCRPEVTAQEALLTAENECLKNELHAANVKIASITSDYNSLKDEYSVVKNQLNQTKEVHTQAKNKIASQNADYKAVCSARDSVISQLQSVRAEYESYQENTSKEITSAYAELKTIRITACIVIVLAIIGSILSFFI